MAARKPLVIVAGSVQELPTGDTVVGGGDVTLTGTQTLTNKTLTTPVINGFSGTGNGTVTGNLTVTGNTTLGDSAADTVTVSGALSASGSVSGYDIHPHLGGILGSLYWSSGFKSAYAAGGATWGFSSSNDGSGKAYFSVADVSTGVGATATNVRASLEFLPSGAVTIPGPLSVGTSLAVTGALSATTGIQPGSYTVATRPAHAAGKMIYVSDGGGGAVFQGSNGSAWVNLG